MESVTPCDTLWSSQASSESLAPGNRAERSQLLGGFQVFQLRRIFVLLLIAAGIAYAQSAGTAGNNAGSSSSTSVAAVTNAKGGEQADSVENQQLRQLPINRRNFLDFTFLTPSVADSHMILGTGTNDFRV